MVDDLEDREEDRKNEDDEDQEGKAFDWSKLILIDRRRNYVRAREKQLQREEFVPPKDSVAAKLTLEIKK